MTITYIVTTDQQASGLLSRIKIAVRHKLHFSVYAQYSRQNVCELKNNEFIVTGQMNGSVIFGTISYSLILNNLQDEHWLLTGLQIVL